MIVIGADRRKRGQALAAVGAGTGGRAAAARSRLMTPGICLEREGPQRGVKCTVAHTA
jgi:hypothetical protein